MNCWPPPSSISSLRAIPLETVLPLCGAQRDRHDRRKWHTAQGVLAVTGTKFMNWTQGVGGGGAIDLVIHLHRLDFKAALDWLGQRFAPVGPPAAPAPAPQRPFERPAPDPAQLGRVQRYLVTQRAIPAALVQWLTQSDSLYADRRANVVFLMRPLWATCSQPIPAAVGAELRGTSAYRWRGLAPGSRKDHGCFGMPPLPLASQDPPRPKVILCESAIDALSCFALHPKSYCLSTAGARPDPAWLGLLLRRGCHVFCGFDADPTGDAMAQALIGLHPTVQRLRPPAHDWNDLLKSRP